jgi:hypothetical protein
MHNRCVTNTFSGPKCEACAWSKNKIPHPSPVKKPSTGAHKRLQTPSNECDANQTHVLICKQCASIFIVFRLKMSAFAFKIAYFYPKNNPFSALCLKQVNMNEVRTS